MKKAFAINGILLFIMLSSAFADTQVGRLPKNSLAVPLVRQSTSYSCGAAVMLAVLSYWQIYDGDESSLFSALGTTAEMGTDPLNMAKLAQEKGLNTSYRLGQTLDDLAQALTRGETVIVDYQAWHELDRNSSGSTIPAYDYSKEWEDGHYSVVVGIDEQNIYLMDPSVLGSYAYLKRQDFLSRWHDYEIREGQRVENHQLAIMIKGKNARRNFPAPLVHVD